MSNLFRNANNFDQNLNSWDVSSVQSFYGTFAGAVSLIPDITSWDVSNATNFGGMFYEAKSFSKVLEIGMWVMQKL